MKFLLLNGSERNGGNTDDVVALAEDLVVKAGGLPETIALRDQQIAPCAACGDCNWRETRCELDDDASKVVAQLIDADAIIYLAPVHGFGLPHLMQIFIERAGVGYLRFDRSLADKVGGVVVVGRRYNHGAVHDQLVNNLLLNRMILVGSGYPVQFHAGPPGTAVRDAEARAALEALILRMAGMTAMLQDASRAELDHPLHVLAGANERAPQVSSSQRVSVWKAQR